jgi:hypothetical protein
MNSKKQRGGSCAARKSLKGGSAAKKALKGGSAAKKTLKGGSAKKALKGGSSSQYSEVHTESSGNHGSSHSSESVNSHSATSTTPKPTMHQGGASSGRKLYCFKCKTKVAAKNVSEMSKKTKTRTVKMAKGVCPKCGGKVFGIVGGGH